MSSGTVKSDLKNGLLELDKAFEDMVLDEFEDQTCLAEIMAFREATFDYLIATVRPAGVCKENFADILLNLFRKYNDILMIASGD